MTRTSAGALTNQLKNKILFQAEMKYLGIIIDPNLNYKKHVEYITNKLKKYYNKIRALYGHTYRMDTKKREILYNALFRSIIEYGSLAYFDKLRKTEIKKLKTRKNNSNRSNIRL